MNGRAQSVSGVAGPAAPGPVLPPPPRRLTIQERGQAYIYVFSGTRDELLPPSCPGSEGYYDVEFCGRLNAAVLLRPTANPADVEAARAEATTVKWLLTNTDSKAALLRATEEEVWQRLHSAGYRQLVVRPARRDRATVTARL